MKEVTTVFADPMTGHYWFLLSGELKCAIINVGTQSIIPSEVGLPEVAAEYHCQFISKLLSDIDYQLVFDHLFFITETENLVRTINSQSNIPLKLNPKYPK